MPKLFDVFISYGCKDSKDFAIQLNDELTKQGFKVWFNLNDMPCATEFQKEIDEAIEKSHNFVFIIANHAVNSEYCYQEIELAVKLNKRIIPIMYLAPKGCWEKMHPIIKKHDQIFWHQDKLDNGEIDFAAKFAELVSALRRHADYVELHTRILVAARNWQTRLKQRRDLLIGEEHQNAVAWLKKRFENEPLPTLPTDLQCEYICESTVNANNLLTQVFIGYAPPDHEFAFSLRKILLREHITVWWDTHTPETLAEYYRAETLEDIEKADNFIYLLSPHSLQSKVCDEQLKHALALQKRVLALVIAPTSTLSLTAHSVPIIDFTADKNSASQELLRTLHEDAYYHEQHKILLVKAAPTPLQQELIVASLRTIVTAEKKFELELNQRVEERTAELKTKLSAAQLVNSNLQTLLYVGCGLALLVVIGLSGWHAFQQPECEKSVECEPVIPCKPEKPVPECKPEKIEPVPKNEPEETEPLSEGTPEETEQKNSEKDGESFRDTLADGSKGPEMVWIPAGTFLMGDIQGSGSSDEGPVHEVSVDKFAMGRYEVTFDEYDKFAEATGRNKPNDRGWGRGDRPVIKVSWNDATAYTEWLSEETGYEYRLPTEAEWEYAARGGTETNYWWGNEIGSNKANCRNSICDDNFKYTSPVGSFDPNPFGLYDMAGNVWEWTCSEYENKYKGKELLCAKNVNKNTRLCLRGGSWYVSAWWLRSMLRNWRVQAGRSDVRGFRVARL